MINVIALSECLDSVTLALADALKEAKRHVTVAESCTGGGVAYSMTSIPGSSAWFERSFVTYSNQAKHKLLGVKKRSLKQFGAVSAEVVEEMAIGALKQSDSEISVAISGIAGPDGGTEEKPVGTVWFAWALEFDKEELDKDGRDKKEPEKPVLEATADNEPSDEKTPKKKVKKRREVESACMVFSGNRQQVRLQAMLFAMQGLLARTSRFQASELIAETEE